MLPTQGGDVQLNELIHTRRRMDPHRQMIDCILPHSVGATVYIPHAHSIGASLRKEKAIQGTFLSDFMKDKQSLGCKPS